MAEAKFLENRLRSWTPVLAEAVEDEIRRAAAPHPDPTELDCRSTARALRERVLE
jgi:hypothetical protein